MANWWERGFSEAGIADDAVANDAADSAVSDAPAINPLERLREVDRRTLLIFLGLVLLVIVARGADLLRERQLTTQTRQSQLRQTIAAELAARRQGDQDAYVRLLDPQATRSWRQQELAALDTLPLPIPGEEPPIIQDWQFRDGTAMVELRFPGPPAARQTRFYRWLGDGWRRTEPIAAYWGALQSARAPGVAFVYRDADSQAIARVVEAVQTAHQQGDISVLAGEPLTVEIVPAQIVEYDSQVNRLTLPSPRLTARLTSVPDSVPILWLLAYPVADRLLDPADSARYRYLDTLQLFQDHVRYWPVRWEAPLPERWDRQMLDTLLRAREEGRLVAPRAMDLYAANRSQSYLAYYATLTMSDYIAATYGAGKLLALDQTLSQFGAWEESVPAALGIEMAEFERGWRTYLDARLAEFAASAPAPEPTQSPDPG
jgi:hypothetical protein